MVRISLDWGAAPRSTDLLGRPTDLECEVAALEARLTLEERTRPASVDLPFAEEPRLPMLWDSAFDWDVAWWAQPAI